MTCTRPDESNNVGPINADSSKYGFEQGPMGWEVQTMDDSKAFASLRISEVPRFGNKSLEVTVGLTKGDPDSSKGEVWVNWQKAPHESLPVPADLESLELTAYVFAPPGSGGPESSPNGLQVFVKDSEWRSEYGTWKNITENYWNKVSLKVSRTRPDAGHMDSGFDPAAIIAIGLKMGVGSGGDTEFHGKILLDGVDWK